MSKLADKFPNADAVLEGQVAIALWLNLRELVQLLKQLLFDLGQVVFMLPLEDTHVKQVLICLVVNIRHQIFF